MRKKFVYFILVPLIVVLLVVYLFIDGWVESGLEAAGQAIVGARVEIDDLHLSLSPLGMEFGRLQVANPRDPWKNIFETGRVNFKMNFNQLLRGKYIIDSVEVSSLILATKRTTDGSLPQEPPEEAPEAGEPSLTTQVQSYVSTQTAEVPIFDLEKLRRQLNIDSLLNIRNLRSLQHLDSLKQQTQAISDSWKATLAEVDRGKEDLRTVESNIRSIDAGELKSLEALTSAYSKITDSYKTVDNLSRSFQTHKNSILTDAQRLTAAVGSIDNVVQEDIRAVQELARLPDLSLGGLSSLLLGESVLPQVQQYLGYIELAGSTVRKYSPKPERQEVPRFAGQNIAFPVERSYPKFWIRRIHISGGTQDSLSTESFSASGDASDITDNQDLTGNPTVIALAGSQAGRATFTFRGTLDRRGDATLDQYRVNVSSIPVGQFSLGRSSFLPSRITESIADIGAEITVPSGRFDASSSVFLRNLHLVFDTDPRTTVERLTHDVLAQINSLRISLHLWNTAGPLQVAFASDLDDQLRSRVQRVLGDELARIQNDIRTKVNQEIAEKRAEVQRFVDQKKREAQVKLQEYENLLKEKIALAEGKKKEIEQRIEEEKRKQTDAAKKKVEDAVKGIFKKKP